MSASLVVTRDPALLEELQRLCAAAGVAPDVVTAASEALALWPSAPLVLVGADVAAALAAVRPPRREAVHVVGLDRADAPLFVAALHLGAETVTQVGPSRAWLTEVLGDAGESAPVRGVLVGVVGGCGGAGASVLAAAMGQAASRSGPALLIDADPLGAGQDRLLGLEACEGIRWDALEQTTGRLSARALRDAVPARSGLGVLTWSPRSVSTLQAFAVREAIAAGLRGHRTVVVDLPRSRVGPSGEVVEEVMARCELVVVVTRPDLLGVAGAARMLAHGCAAPVRLVVRGGGGASLSDIARVTGVREPIAMGDQRRLSESLDLGQGPPRSPRGPLARTASALLAQAVPRREAA